MNFVTERSGIMEVQSLYGKYPFAELKSVDAKGRLRIYTYAYEYPNANDGGDSDWYMNYIDLTCHGFSATLDEPVLEGRVLEGWYKDLEDFIGLKRRYVELYATEPNLSFSIESDLKNKNIHVKGDVINSKPNTYRSYLQFEFFTNLDYINRFKSGINTILEAFPPRYK